MAEAKDVVHFLRTVQSLKKLEAGETLQIQNARRRLERICEMRKPLLIFEGLRDYNKAVARFFRTLLLQSQRALDQGEKLRVKYQTDPGITRSIISEIGQLTRMKTTSPVHAKRYQTISDDNGLLAIRVREKKIDAELEELAYQKKREVSHNLARRKGHGLQADGSILVEFSPLRIPRRKISREGLLVRRNKRTRR